MTQQEHVSPIPIPITPELARTHQDIYTTRAIELLHETTYGGLVWDACIHLGYIRGVDLVNARKSSYNRTSKRIKLGVDHNPNKRKHTSHFEPHLFPYEKETIFILAHETAHAWLPHLFAHIPTLITWAEGAERLHKENKSLTALANQEGYRKKGAHTQAKEDLAQLTAMYLWDPAYLSRYFDFLASTTPEDIARKQTHNLVTVKRTVTQQFESILQTGISLVQSGILLES